MVVEVSAQTWWRQICTVDKSDFPSTLDDVSFHSSYEEKKQRKITTDVLYVCLRYVQFLGQTEGTVVDTAGGGREGRRGRKCRARGDQHFLMDPNTGQS